jgi:hypothetical protein
VDLSPWLTSLRQAFETGAAFSALHPISNPAACNAIGQRYYGPVVLVTNALCYSATDIFTAGFRDHRVGIILGTDGNTGAGGANPFDHALLRTLFSRRGRLRAGSPLEKLPNGSSLHVAIRRTVRVGAHSGTLLEDLGVVPDERHWMTRNDVMKRNADLIESAGRLLAKLPCYILAVEPLAPGSTALDVMTGNITRLDVLLDGRPIYSGKVKDGDHACPLDPPLRNGARLELRGYKGAELVAVRKLEP